MYERFYNLRERPFALSPDPEYLYPSRVHQEALDYLRYGLESHAGFVVITGEIGSGKTTLLQTVLRNLDSHTTVARVVNTMLEPREVLETIMLDFGLEPGGRSKPMLLRDLAQFLVDQRLAGRMVLVVIDEAQNLSLAALEELRMLSNLETEKSKLLQVVLVGQPNLRDKLASPELEQLRQRITVSYHLAPLDTDEAAKYINHRLARAALGAPLQFPRDATDAIHRRSRGIPRIINIVCDATLVFGYAEERRLIDRGLVEEALAELEATGVLPKTDGHARADERPAPATAERTEPAEPAGTAAETQPAHSARILDARSWPPPAAARTAPPEDGRSAALDQREEVLLQRERELAEQRRVLAEEYRLMWMQRSAEPARDGSRTARDSRAPEPVAAARGRESLERPIATTGARTATRARYETIRPETFWERVKRIMLGVSA